MGKLSECSGDLTSAEKKEYIAAVLCLTKAPSKLSAAKYPGAKSRFDDFVVVHMNMTPHVHGTVSSERSAVMTSPYLTWI